MKIGIYGGSFNPPHLGHLAAAEGAARYLKLDKLVLIPAGDPPHKALSPDAPSGAHRFAMTRMLGEQAAFDTGISVEVSDMELTREGKSYTADTVRLLRAQYPDDELWLLMGTDMFLTFQSWYRPEEIVRYAGICAFGRAETDGEVQGTIAFAPMGEGGFGYDPVFFVPDKRKTFAQLTAEEKAEISHRGNALRAFKEKLADYLAGAKQEEKE